MSKKQNEKKHFKRRCQERVGHSLIESDLIGLIHANKLPFVRRTSNTRTCWKYVEDGNEYLLVYDNSRKTLVTVYPYKNKCGDK